MRALIALLALGLGLTSADAASAEKRVALVIGNSAYKNAEELPNPRNDAEAMAEALRTVGFEVKLAIDADQLGMREVLRQFGLQAETADVALVYYAGHGIQVEEHNYLLPVDAQLERERDLLYEALPLDLVLDEVAQAEKLGVVILDACRDNPLAEQLRRALGPIRSRLVGRGLARVEAPPSDTLVAFSTKAGELSVDGAGRHSPYTEALLKHIEEPGLELTLLFRKVRDAVLAATANRQDPRYYDALGAEPFYFIPPRPNQRPVLPQLAALEVLDDAGPTPLDIGQPSDPDDDPLTAQITGLPQRGTIQVGDRPLLIGDVLTVDQLMTATFAPERGAVGDAGVFTFLLEDDRGGTAIGRMAIKVERSNKPPVVETTAALTLPSIPLNIRAPVDPDGDPLTITVAEVPTRGAIKVGDRAVAAGDELTPEELAALVLEPTAEGALGRFAFKVTDSRGASTTSAIRTNLPGIAAAPTQTALATPREPPAPQKPKVAKAPPPATTQPADQPGRNMNKAPRVAPAAPSGRQVAALGGELYETVRASNIRSGPSAETARVTTVPAGAVLRVLGRAEGRNWFRVETEAGQSGYIFSQLVRPKPGAGAGTPRTPPAATPAPKQQAAPAPKVEPKVKKAAVPVARIAGDVLKDCETCPELVELPAGSFLMGSKSGDRSERPVHRVKIAKPFALGRTEVTVAQWDACVAAGSCSPRSELSGVSASSPVHNLSWEDARDYVAWLREVTGKPYRLPSEAEWEYAARAGTATRYWWGDAPGASHANCKDCGGTWDRKTPATVASYQASPFGLYDMNGGVMEWVEDCWTESYDRAPRDGSAQTGGDCSQRVLRGGSWRNDSSYATASSRLSYDAGVRYYTNGFRVARDLEK